MTNTLEGRIESAAQKLKHIIATTRQSRAQNTLNRSQTALQTMRKHARVNAHWPIAWPFWPQGVRNKIIALLQKITRRLLRWYIDPIVIQQNQFNQATLQTVQLLTYELQAIRILIEQNQLADQKQTQALLSRLDSVETELKTLKQTLPQRD